MTLTKAQRRLLAITRSFRERPPTVWVLIRLNWWIFVSLFAVFGLMLIPLLMFAVSAGFWEPCMTWIGVFIGMLIRDYASLRQTCRKWPLNQQIIDWQRVDELLAASAPPRSA